MQLFDKEEFASDPLALASPANIRVWFFQSLLGFCVNAETESKHEA